MKTPHEGGRPKSEFDLPSNWKEEIHKLYEVGASDTEIKTLIFKWRGTFSNDLFYRWMDEETEFSEAVRMGRFLSQTWWEKNGRENLTTQYFNAQLFNINMKNRFGWADKQEIDHKSTDGTMSPPTRIKFTKGVKK